MTDITFSSLPEHGDSATVTDKETFSLWVKYADGEESVWFTYDDRNEALDAFDALVKTMEQHTLIDAGVTRINETVTFTTVETHVGATK